MPSAGADHLCGREPSPDVTIANDKESEMPTYDDKSINHTTDGLGNPLIPDAEYYVQDTRSQVGNCTLFWGKDRSGYVCNLDEAGLYTGAAAAGMRDTDIAWPVAHILEYAVRHVRVEGLARTRSHDIEQRQQAAMRKWLAR